MKLSFSRKGDRRGRHVVLFADHSEAAEVYPVLLEVVGGNRLVRDWNARGPVVFHFNLKYLGALLLAIPQAELSDGIRNRQIAVEAKRLADLPVPDLDIPGLQGELYDYQKVAVGVILENPRYFLNDDLGLGKTVIGLSVLAYLDSYPALVVCPNSAKWVWKDEAAKFFPAIDVQIIAGTAAERAAQIETEADVYAINYELLWRHPELFQKRFEYMIADEYHRIKNPTAKQTRAFHKLHARHYLMMSGTPIMNKVEDLWSPLYRCYPKAYPTFGGFERTHVIKTEGRFPKTIGYHPLAMRDLRTFSHDHSLRRRKEHVLDELPEVRHLTEYTELSPEQQRRYAEVRDDAIMRMDNGEVRNIRGVLPIITRLKQACFSPELWGGTPKSSKVERLKELVSDITAEGHKVIVFSQWAKAARIIERELEAYNPAYVDGTVTGKERRAQATRFNTDPECRIYIGTIRANKESISLGAASYVIFSDEDWVPFNNDQAIGRSAAGGLRGRDYGIEKVTVIDLFARDTVETRLKAILQTKRNIGNAVVERDGGAKIERISLADIRALL